MHSYISVMQHEKFTDFLSCTLNTFYHFYQRISEMIFDYVRRRKNGMNMINLKLKRRRKEEDKHEMKIDIVLE